jgi:hypothetical protein
MKVAELSGELLDAQVWLALGPAYPGQPPRPCPIDWRPSTNWAQAGPIIEREKISIDYEPAWPESTEPAFWGASLHIGETLLSGHGETPLLAAMRCYVARVFGDEVPDSAG